MPSARHTSIIALLAATLLFGCTSSKHESSIADNFRTIHVIVDVKDEQGNAVPGVSASISKYSVSPNPLEGDLQQSETDERRTFDGTLDYSTFGNYAICISFSKTGYATAQALYSTDDVIHRPKKFLGEPAYDERAINVDKQPRQSITLHKLN